MSIWPGTASQLTPPETESDGASIVFTPARFVPLSPATPEGFRRRLPGRDTPFNLESDIANTDRAVSRRPDGTWANKKDGAGRASSTHSTQRGAIDAARGMMKTSGGRELCRLRP